MSTVNRKSIDEKVASYAISLSATLTMLSVFAQVIPSNIVDSLFYVVIVAICIVVLTTLFCVMKIIRK
jgi:ABC-type protease/lipase transport system fused ATPase/permease subunit